MALTMRRVRELSDTAALIAAGKFSARTPTSGSAGPFDRIADAQNAMLDRIEDLVTGLKTVTDSLAHDLRTPLARLRTRLERGILAPDLESKQAALEGGLRETEKTILAFSSLIDIARAEGGLSREAMTTVDLKTLVQDVHELFLPLAEERGLSLDLASEDCQILGHKPLLMQAIGNLAHNAIKHAPDATHVGITLHRSAGQAQIVVTDHGPGIPANKRADAVKRFQRLGAGDTPEGVGLGLAIVEACARLHRGTLLLDDNHPGLKATLTLEAATPIAAAESAEAPRNLAPAS
jgi:signal transduction histidine kinase